MFDLPQEEEIPPMKVATMICFMLMIGAAACSPSRSVRGHTPGTTFTELKGSAVYHNILHEGWTMQLSSSGARCRCDVVVKGPAFEAKDLVGASELPYSQPLWTEEVRGDKGGTILVLADKHGTVRFAGWSAEIRAAEARMFQELNDPAKTIQEVILDRLNNYRFE